jgi:hypothetical protein
MQKIIVIAFSFVSFQVYAQKWMVELPAKINNAVSGIEINRSCNDGQEITSSTSKNPYNSCLKKICGDPSEYKSTFQKWLEENAKLINTDLSSTEKSDIGKKLIANIDKYFELESTSFEVDKDELNNEILKLRKDYNSFLLPSSGEAGVLTVLEAFKVFEYSDDASEEYTIKNDYFQGKTGKELEMAKFLAKSTETYMRDPRRGLRSFSSIGYIKSLYPDKNEADAIVQYVKDMNKLAEESKASLGSLFPLGIDFNSVNLKIGNESLSPADLDIFVQQTGMLEIIQIALNYQKKYGQYIAKKKTGELIDWYKNNDDVAIKKRLAEMEEKSKLDREKEKEEIIKKSIDAKTYCLQSIKKNQSLLPTQKEVDGLKSISDEAKKYFIQKVNALSTLSIESKKVIVSKLEQLTFKTPFSNEQYTKNLSENLDVILKEAQARNGLYTSGDFQKSHGSLLLYILAFPESFNDDESEDNSGETDDEALAQSDILELCRSLEQEPFSDATYTAYGSVALSYTMAKAPVSYQRQVIYHEMAHNVDAIMKELGISSSSLVHFQKVRNCLYDVQKSMGVEKPKQYFGEDFADALAYQFSDTEEKPKMCEYLQLENGEYSSHTILNENESDVHSSDIFRIIRYYIDKNISLPQTCQDAIESEGILDYEKSCKI